MYWLIPSIPLLIGNLAVLMGGLPEREDLVRLQNDYLIR